MQLATTPGETLKRWAAVPPLASISALGGPRPGAAVLAVTGGPGGAPRALVAVQRYGLGRSMIFTGEAAWRWRMMLPTNDQSYDRFWRQAARWLGQATPDPVAVTLPVAPAAGDPVPITIDVRDKAFVPQRDATVDVRVTSPDGHVEAIRGEAVPTQPGRFRASTRAIAIRHLPDHRGRSPESNDHRQHRRVGAGRWCRSGDDRSEAQRGSAAARRPRLARSTSSPPLTSRRCSSASRRAHPRPRWPSVTTSGTPAGPSR